MKQDNLSMPIFNYEEFCIENTVLLIILRSVFYFSKHPVPWYLDAYRLGFQKETRIVEFTCS